MIQPTGGMMTPKQQRAERKAEQAAKRRKRQDLAGKAARPVPFPVCSARLARKGRMRALEFVARGCYIDEPYTCIDCGADQVWTAAKQKEWFEVARHALDAQLERCPPCERAAMRRIFSAKLLRKYGSLERAYPKQAAAPPATPDAATPDAAHPTPGRSRRRRTLGRRPPPDGNREASPEA